jgi:hypothetical protein
MDKPPRQQLLEGMDESVFLEAYEPFKEMLGGDPIHVLPGQYHKVLATDEDSRLVPEVIWGDDGPMTFEKATELLASGEKFDLMLFEGFKEQVVGSTQHFKGVFKDNEAKPQESFLVKVSTRVGTEKMRMDAVFRECSTKDVRRLEAKNIRFNKRGSWKFKASCYTEGFASGYRSYRTDYSYVVWIDQDGKAYANRKAATS